MDLTATKRSLPHHCHPALFFTAKSGYCGIHSGYGYQVDTYLPRSGLAPWPDPDLGFLGFHCHWGSINYKCKKFYQQHVQGTVWIVAWFGLPALPMNCYTLPLHIRVCGLTSLSQWSSHPNTEDIVCILSFLGNFEPSFKSKNQLVVSKEERLNVIKASEANLKFFFELSGDSQYSKIQRTQNLAELAPPSQ